MIPAIVIPSLLPCESLAITPRIIPIIPHIIDIIHENIPQQHNNENTTDITPNTNDAAAKSCAVLSFLFLSAAVSSE